MQGAGVQCARCRVQVPPTLQATNDDATGCKLSAVTLGYWGDNYIQYMAKRGTRRAPEIHLGYYARVQGVRALVDRVFSACDTAVQVISLGAGFDTTFWRLVEEGRPLRRYIEVDLPGVTARKCFMVKRHKQLLAAVGGEEGEVRLNRTDLHSPRWEVQVHVLVQVCRCWGAGAGTAHLTQVPPGGVGLH